MNIDKPCHNSSCEPTATGRRSKKSSRIAHGVFDTDFFDLFFWCKGILNGFASVSACGCLGSDCRVICYYLVHIYCPKESKCHALARFVLFVRLVFEKHIRVWIILSWPQISRIKRIYTGSQPTRFVRFVRLVFEKHISVWIILSWPQISRIKRIYTGSQPTRFVRFVRLVFEKHISVWIILSWPQISLPRIHTGSQPKRFVRFVRLVFEKTFAYIKLIH